jgi:universal stress protein A
MDEMTAGVAALFRETQETEAQRLLQASLARVQRAGLQGESLLVQGTPTQMIVDTAGEQGVDLILMGTHGRTGLAHVFLGSVTEHVVRQGPCPVLVVRRAPDTAATVEEALPEQA